MGSLVTGDSERFMHASNARQLIDTLAWNEANVGLAGNCL